MAPRSPWLIGFVLLALGACSLPVVDKQADGDARALFDEIRAGADLSKDQDLAAPLNTPDALAGLAALRTQIPDGAPQKVVNQSFNFETANGDSTATLVHAYQYPKSTVVAETALHKAPGQTSWSVVGFHIEVDPKT
ncbi:MAG: hypothetical protein ACHP7N_14910 [Caulobacterales bacterium]